MTLPNTQLIMQLANISFVAGNKSRRAFTLAEVVMAIAISMILFGGIIVGYTVTCRRAEWSGYSLAAQALAVQQIEQARAAVWYSNGINQITNLNLLGWANTGGVVTGYTTNTLDIPISGTNNVVYATNFVTIRMINNIGGVAAVAVQMVRVDTVWPFSAGKARKLYTNTVATYLAPDNRDPTTL
jgi:hypothetical protein